MVCFVAKATPMHVHTETYQYPHRNISIPTQKQFHETKHTQEMSLYMPCFT